ncbi:amino acid ABC transporter permease [Ilumatobacter nonamiensis]|uniref:amino acid ABC transporter permease n=1 Tax=Ilumatobacter nonamiensis TaxID=467093 RepID=UPI00034819AE|nr:amino acid ABC transporter permease [Ilumatobacter nonamiensis]
MSPQTRREAYERRQRRRSLLIASASTVIVVAAVIVLVPRAPRWDRVKTSFFNRDIFVDTFPGLLRAFWLDVQIFLWSLPLIFVLSLAIAIARNTRSPAFFPLRAFAVIYTDVFRGVPVILTIFLIGFGVPGLFDSRTWSNPLIWGTVALVLSYSAYVSEEIRAGIEGVHESQRAAARSLGMSSRQTMSTVVLPQALRRIVPPMMNSIVSLQKDVALISLIGPVEILRQAGIDKAKFANFTPYVGAAVIFLALTIPMTRVADYLLARERKRTGATVVA